MNKLYVFLEAILSTYRAGGAVMLPILISGVIGFYFLYASWMRLGRDFFKNNLPGFIQKMEALLADGKRREARNLLRQNKSFVAKELLLALEKTNLSVQELYGYMTVRLLDTHRYLDKGTHVIAVMAIIAPLLGLLGTVTGMVATFDVITLYGNQNPVLMADGISEALITTQSGLLIAFPLTLLKQRLDDRIEMIKQQIELGATVILNYQLRTRGENHGI
ncbi:MAG: MotA/TolQ/ExbB proton channel family protein [Fibrobacter sp.]|jgi:biopolymer transport protein ExbB|nr:MotA/TolQ/ExbB proton channel family protein [Fibrobacter sp.]